MFKRIRAFPWSKSREKCMMISFRRIFEPNLYGWCIICVTHLRSTYFWAASLDGNSRCRHNPSILIFACMFCENGSEFEKDPERSAYPLESMWFIPFYASNISCPRVFSFTKASSIAILLYTSGDNKLEPKIILGVILV